ncbi:MAG: hypothetical protein HOV81_42360 [Kofleriaceae bacterium]|nr:hypothetical protein [Kofleriaceae bacterium]
MRFLMTYNGNDKNPDPQKLQEIEAFGREMIKSGVLLDSGGILPLASKLEIRGGKFSHTDGPFPETKELVVGYAIVQVKSQAEAVEVARRFMAVAGDGTGEIRQLVGPADGPPR